jgi:UDP-N-acetylglucosamine--N-acetylmuramyl-(pentapeptide) pyrophosphoryl-undecaprenol N-acetylglucosamine transferase
MLRLLVSAGGTGGGVYPALAVVEALVDEVEVLWIGGEGGMEISLVGRTEIPLRTIPAAGVHGVGLRALPNNLLQLGRGILAARRVIQDYLPDVILFTGGYVGIPVSIAGRRIPQVIFTPDIEPALASKVISRSAEIVTVSAEESRSYYGNKKLVKVTGYPTRNALQHVDRERAREIMGLNSEQPVLLVFGGSRGARSINFALWRRLSVYLKFAEVIHITGELDWPQVERIKKALGSDELTLYHPHPYLHEEMIAALGAAELIVSRAGASALGEYPILGVPSVLIPYPHAWRYQKVNADYLAGHGAAVIVNDLEVDDRLLPAVKDLLSDQDKLAEMTAAAKKLAKPEAARSIAIELERFARGADQS